MSLLGNRDLDPAETSPLASLPGLIYQYVAGRWNDKTPPPPPKTPFPFTPKHRQEYQRLSVAAKIAFEAGDLEACEKIVLELEVISKEECAHVLETLDGIRQSGEEPKKYDLKHLTQYLNTMKVIIQRIQKDIKTLREARGMPSEAVSG